MFGCYSYNYFGLDAQFRASGLSIWGNLWNEVFDFTPVGGEQIKLVLGGNNAHIVYDETDAGRSFQYKLLPHTTTHLALLRNAANPSSADALRGQLQTDLKLVNDGMPSFIPSSCGKGLLCVVLTVCGSLTVTNPC